MAGGGKHHRQIFFLLVLSHFSISSFPRGGAQPPKSDHQISKLPLLLQQHIGQAWYHHHGGYKNYKILKHFFLFF